MVILKQTDDEEPTTTITTSSSAAVALLPHHQANIMSSIGGGGRGGGGGGGGHNHSNQQPNHNYHHQNHSEQQQQVKSSSVSSHHSSSNSGHHGHSQPQSSNTSRPTSHQQQQPHYRPQHYQQQHQQFKHHQGGGQYIPSNTGQHQQVAAQGGGGGGGNYHHHHGGQHHNYPGQHYHQARPQHQQQSSNHHYHHHSSTSTSAPDAAQTAASTAAQPSFDIKLFESIKYPFCAEYSKYETVLKIGQGTFGEVFKARCKKTGEFVALKKILTDNEKEGFPITALREIKILQVLRHENIVRLIEICASEASASNKYKSEFYLVFEFCEHDLAGLLTNPTVKFSLGEQKKIMQQLLNGLYFIHKNLILHRDMKTANILVTKDGKLKLADFGLARSVVQSDQPTKYTNRVVTLWYRPPELLLGERCYNKAIDIWGSGCIMAELWTREPILKGNSEQNQLELIQSLCGSITTEVWPDVEKLELYNKMRLRTDLKRRIRERLGPYVKDQCGLDLLEHLLTLDPKKRIDSDEALDHDFFWTEPMPTDLKLDKINSSMFEYTTQNLKRAAAAGAGGVAAYRPNKPAALTNDQHYDRVY